jgi:hypothetical protein
MANPERKPQPTPAQHLESLPPPARISDGIHAVDVTKQGETLFLRVSKGEQALFTAALLPDNQVHVAFGVGTAATLPETTTLLATGETKQAPEHPAITIEGFPVCGAKYDKDEKTGKRTYSLTLAHHPDPNRRKEEVVYYEIVAEGDKAEECYRAYVTDSRTPVRITGDDYSYTQQRKNKPDRIVHKIQADSVEKIKGRLDSPDILHEKVRLSDLQE